MGNKNVTTWELRAFGNFAVAGTELECWLNFFGLTGKLIDGPAFMGMVDAHKKAGIVAKEIRHG